ncbi:hypothetical protein [Candidatus Villigracilis saccharophilus]|uniref:hypothetical protein n=1 Tax=Candidatus Villigracilis saccharophilus TaxID=3140684 RepID=UPI003134E435|nr:hypothetical protein [Anaerolineales bacterium]
MESSQGHEFPSAQEINKPLDSTPKWIRVWRSHASADESCVAVHISDLTASPFNILQTISRMYGVNFERHVHLPVHAGESGCPFFLEVFPR